MKYDVTDYQFSDLATFSYGKMPKKSKINVNGKYPIYSGYRYVGYYDEYNIEPRQLIVVARGVGGTGDVKMTTEKCYLTNLSIAVKITETEKVLPEYLYYLFTLNNLRYLDSGSAQSQITINDLGKVHIDLPSINWQKKIVNLLLTIDDKITTNTAINKNLESQAQAIFKSWFVDFEPFGGEMPRDWIISTLGSVSKMGAGGDKPKIVSNKKTSDCQYPIYSNGLSEEGLYGYTNNYKIDKESVTVSARGTIGFVCLRHIPYTPIVRLVVLEPNTDMVSAQYLYFWLKNINIAGTGTTQQQLTVPAFRKEEILLPNYDTMQSFTNVVSPLFNSIWHNQEENQILSQLRDTLLPRLMSGEIDVGKVEV